MNTSKLKKIKPLLLAVGIVLPIFAQGQTTTDTTFIYLRNGGVDAYPSLYAKVGKQTAEGLEVSWEDGTTIHYDNASIENISHKTPENLPQLTMFKVNNKYNDQVFTDVVADINGDEVNLQIGCIGKWLTPSFQLSDDNAEAYVNFEKQTSKVSRHHFDKDIVYTVAMPEMRILRRHQLTEEIWIEGDTTIIPITLTTSQLSTNAPSNYDEGLDKMLDGDPTTFFHSTWGQGQYEKLPDNECPYIDIRLEEPIKGVQWTMTTRSGTDRMPRKIELLASADGANWKSIAVYTNNDGLPVTPGSTFKSPPEDLSGEYNYLRLKLLEASYKNYFCVAELRVAKVIFNKFSSPKLIEPATYKYEMEPYGHDYLVHVDWLADNAANVPVINIRTNNGKMISSKDIYLDAEITIDGAGVFPSMPSTPVHIKGRGNSSWSSNQWDKNPYRLKFDEKMKPFGMTKGKSWVLLANKQSGSMMSNAIGMKAACLAETAGANHIIPVELYINGQYRGNYNFTEKVGLSNNSIDLEDETSAVLLELDTYYDETYKFKSNPYNLPVNIKEPDFSEGVTNLTQTEIMADFNNAMRQLNSRTNISTSFDLEYLARYLMVNELIENFELMHPKSTFLYKENLKTGTKYIFGPVWDLDWAYGYEFHHNYCRSEQEANYYTRAQMEATRWLNDLRYASKELDRIYYKVWTQFMTYSLDELLDYCDEYFTYAKPSLENNGTLWGDGLGYATVAKNTREWLKQRAKYVYQNLTAYDLTEEELAPPAGISDTPIVDNPMQEENMSGLVDVYNIQGQCVKHNMPVMDLRKNLAPGIYIVNGKKLSIK